MLTNTSRLPYLLLILLGSILLFVPFLGATHLFDWDEINFAESSREMIISNNYLIPQVNFESFWEKPPFFFWLQVLSMKLFGVNEFASRFPNAVAGIITLLFFYSIGKKRINSSFALLWVFIYAASLLPHLYFKSGIIDPWFNLFIFSSIYQLSLHQQNKDNSNRISNIIFAGVFAGLAVLTKGPVGLLIVGLTVSVFYLFHLKQITFKLILDYFLFLFIAILVGSVWFIALYSTGQESIIVEFIQYQIRLFTTEDADHGGPFIYHFIVLLVGCFPASVLAISSMLKNETFVSDNNQKFIPHLKKWMMVLFWVGLILFSIVKTKIVHYSSICYFPLSYLATITLYKYWVNKEIMPKWSRYLQILIGFALAFALMVLPFIEYFKPFLLKPGLIKDEFAVNCLQAVAPWNGWEWLGGFVLFLGLFYFIKNIKTNTFNAFMGLLISSLICFNLAIVFIAPNVEPYSQGASIEFFIKQKEGNAVVEPLGFRSYGHFFYANRQPKFRGYTADKILNGEIKPTVPVYFVVKIHQAKEQEALHPEIKKLYQKNGFVFYKLITKKNNRPLKYNKETKDFTN